MSSLYVPAHTVFTFRGTSGSLTDEDEGEDEDDDVGVDVDVVVVVDDVFGVSCVVHPTSSTRLSNTAKIPR